MKNIPLFLFLLILGAPAWAGDDTAASPMAKPAGSAAPAAQTSVYIELKGAAKNVAAVTAGLEKEAVYKDASCSSRTTRKSGKVVKIICTRSNSELMTYLSKNATAKVHWSISAAGCAVGCTMMNCPPPTGPFECCKRTTAGYKPC
jgi:hypothetical protein